MIADYIANFQDFERFRADLDKIIPFLDSRMNSCMATAAQKGARQTVLDFLVGQSPAMRLLRKAIEDNAPGEDNVLITGSSGTGKELVAQAIHCLSPRWDKPFYPLNCGILEKERYGSDLYGHEKGAFTGAHAQRKGAFENAGKGTLFLDEIGELPPSVQTGILRNFQEKNYSRIGGSQLMPIACRIILATNKDLEEEMHNGAFRLDMYYRLIDATIIHCPDLMDREEDYIPLTLCQIIRYMQANKAGATDRREGWRITIRPSFFKAMKSHLFEGNIRELEGVVKRVMVNMTANTLTGRDFQNNVRPLAPRKNHRQPPANQKSVEMLRLAIAAKTGIRDESKAYIASVLASFGKDQFSPKAFIREMRQVHPLHDNTCRKYLRYLHKWDILQHNGKKTDGSLYNLIVRPGNG